MTFSLDATRIYCGHEDAIEVFDVSRPGEGKRIATTPSKKSKDGLKGIVSSIAFSPTYNADGGAFLAAGTLSPTLANLALYNDSQMDVPLMFVGGSERAAVTQLRFNPMNPHILYASYRRREAILAWDLRSDVNVPFARYTVPSSVNALVTTTNQKMWFDVDNSGRRLAVGDQKGNIYLFDLTDEGTTERGITPEEGTPTKQPNLVIPAHSDSVGGVAFHPYQPLLLSVSGSRHYGNVERDERQSDDDDSDADEEEEEEEEDTLRATANSTSNGGSSKLGLRTRPVAVDSSIKTWWFGADDSSV